VKRIHLPAPPTSELQRHLQRSSVSNDRHTGGGSLRDSSATILHSNQRRFRQGHGGLRDSNATILHSNQRRRVNKNINNSLDQKEAGLASKNRSRPKELVDSLQYLLDDSGKCKIFLF